MESYYEERETLACTERERLLFERLPEALARACRRAPAIAAQLQGVETDSIRSRADLQRIPVLRKSELLQAQLAARQANGASGMSPVARIFGGYSAIGWGEAARVFASPGPIYEPESRRVDTGDLRARCMRRASGLATWCTTASRIISRLRGR